MATIASLNVLLGMETGKFASGAKQAQSMLGNLTSSVAALKGAAAGIGIVLGGRQIRTAFQAMLGDAAKIPAVRDSFDRLRSVFGELRATLAQQLAPALIEAANNLVSMAKSGESLKLVQNLAIALGRSLLFVGELIKQAVGFWARWGATIIRTAATVVAFRAILGTIVIAQKAIAAAQAVVLAFAGPAGWAQLAVGAAVAAGAVAAVDVAFAKIEASATPPLLPNAPSYSSCKPSWPTPSARLSNPPNRQTKAPALLT